MLAEFLVGRGPHGAQLATLKRGLQEVGRIHRAARGCARADHRMDFVDEKHGIRVILKLGHHGLEPFLKIAAIAGARKKRAHVEGIDRRIGKDFGGRAIDDLIRKALGNGGLAHAGIPDKEGVVLAPAAEHLNTALDLGIAPDQRVDIPGTRLGVEIDAIFR